MTANEKFEEHLEDYIQDWHWDEKSRKFARNMALFIFEFFGYLKSQQLSESTRRKHESNCQLIGKFVADYGYYDKFSGEILTGKPEYVNIFRRKVADSKYMVESYMTTWRKLAAYAKSQIKQED